MSIAATDRDLVDRLFKAMQAGPAAEEDMMALFADEAVMVEPFSGQVQTHNGKDAVRASFVDLWANPAPDMQIALDRVDLDGPRVKASWTCTSPAFPTPMKGHDLFTISDGKITRLEIVVTEMPPMEDH